MSIEMDFFSYDDHMKSIWKVLFSGDSHRVETIQLAYAANQLTGLFMFQAFTDQYFLKDYML